MIRRFLVKVPVSALAIWAADYLLAGFSVAGGFWAYLLAGLVLGALNTFVRPVLKLVTLPLRLITFGLFTLVINAGILWVTAHWLGTITINDITTLIWSTFIVSAVNLLFGNIGKQNHE